MSNLSSDSCPFEPGSTLHERWTFSARRLERIGAAFEVPGMHAGVAVIAVSGSLGRMEAHRGSDCDLIVVLDDNTFDCEVARADAVGAVWNRLEPLGIARPKPDGVFARPSSRGSLLDPGTLGQIDESIVTFGHRIQLLLDSRPCYQAVEFRQTVDAILRRYATAAPSVHSADCYRVLVDEILRYFRSLTVRTMCLQRHKPGVWRELNIKVRHSRLLNTAAILAVLADAGKSLAKTDDLVKEMSHPPLVRLLRAFDRHEHARRDRVCDLYSNFLRMIADESRLRELRYEETDSLTENAVFDFLMDNANALAHELFDFFLTHHHQEPDSFVRRMMF